MPERDKTSVKVFLAGMSSFPSFDKVENAYKPQVCTWIGSSENGEKKGQYFYQLMPVPMYLKECGIIMDYYLMISTSATERKAKLIDPENKGTIIDNKSPNNYFEDAVIEKGLVSIKFKNDNVLSQFIEKFPEKLHSGERESGRFCFIDSDHGMDTAISSIVHALRALSKEFNVELYIDEHGGARDNQWIVSAIVTLLDGEVSESGKQIIVKKMLTTGIRDNNNNYPISDSSYNIVQFVSGIKEFLVSGRIDNLKEFFKGSQENQDNPLIEILEYISYGILLCDLDIFEEGLNRLKKYKADDSSQNEDNVYLKLFSDTIYNEYGTVIDANEEDGSRIINELRWCNKRKYYQQALTIIESKIPLALNKKGYYICDSELIRELYGNDKPESEDPVLTAFNREIMSDYRKEDYSLTAVLKIMKEPDFECKGKTYTTKNGIICSVNYPDTEDNKREIHNFLAIHRALKERRNDSNHGNQGRGEDLSGTIENVNQCIGEYIKILDRWWEENDPKEIKKRAIEVKAEPGLEYGLEKLKSGEFDFSQFSTEDQEILKTLKSSVDNCVGLTWYKKPVSENDSSGIQDIMNQIDKFMNDPGNHLLREMASFWVSVRSEKNIRKILKKAQLPNEFGLKKGSDFGTLEMPHLLYLLMTSKKNDVPWVYLKLESEEKIKDLAEKLRECYRKVRTI